MDLKDRFTEIMFSIEMLPAVDTKSQEVEEFLQEATLPNLTQDLSNGKLFSALMCQTFKENDEFHMKLCALLGNSALKSITDKDNATRDDLSALCLLANILWVDGNMKSLLGILGTIGGICMKYDLGVPIYLSSILNDNEGAEKFGEFDPYKLLEGNPF